MVKLYTLKELSKETGADESYIRSLITRKILMPVLQCSTGNLYFCEEQLHKLEGYMRQNHELHLHSTASEPIHQNSILFH